MPVLLQRKPSVTQKNSKNMNNRQIFTKFIIQKKENSKNLAEPLMMSSRNVSFVMAPTNVATVLPTGNGIEHATVGIISLFAVPKNLSNVLLSRISPLMMNFSSIWLKSLIPIRISQLKVMVKTPQLPNP